jgi:transcriptional regulator with XRE-family HTH domain
MASEAYLKALKEIPRNIQQDVIGSINLANEIHLALTSQEKTAADLARLLNKSESEISRWLTGTHNFTKKTISKIENALGVELLVTKSSKINEYEQKLIEAELEISNLKNILQLVKEKNRLKNLKFDESISFSISSLLLQNSVEDKIIYGTFFTNENPIQIKIKPESKSFMDVNYTDC